MSELIEGSQPNPEPVQPTPVTSSHDRSGAGDHDRPYEFGKRPRSENPAPFNTHQYARLLIQRSRFQTDPNPMDLYFNRSEVAENTVSTDLQPESAQ